MRRKRRSVLLMLLGIITYTVCVFNYGFYSGSENSSYKKTLLKATTFERNYASVNKSQNKDVNHMMIDATLSPNKVKDEYIDKNYNNHKDLTVLKDDDGRMERTNSSNNDTPSNKVTLAPRNISDEHNAIDKNKDTVNHTVVKEGKDTNVNDIPSKRDTSFYRINTTMSDLIGTNRTVADIRPDRCREIVYPEVLPNISVVIIFREEWPSVLIRTIFSILNHSPRNMLHEIIIVDDGSIDVEPKQQVQTYFAHMELVKLIVNPEPLGLMMARQTGIEATTSDHFVVMDSHLEMVPGWLVPIVARLVEAPYTLLTADVGIIDSGTFEIINGDFDREFISFDPITLFEVWAPFSDTYRRLRNGSVSPIPVAAVQGMLIAMRKDFFMRLGGFDPGMKQWGAEQFELSIKVWMCGGRVEIVPCSKVAHLYRKTPWNKVNSSSDFIVTNALRTADVWIDDPYNSILHDAIGKHSQYDIGNLTDRHKIRKENNCKPFQYFVDMVKTFSDAYFIGKLKAKGCIRNKKLDKCLYVDKGNSYKPGIITCHYYNSQYFILTEHDQIRAMKGTLLRTFINSKRSTKITVDVVKSPEVSYIKHAVWDYRKDGSLYNVATDLCLALSGEKTLVMKKCTGDSKQQWEWKRLA